VTGITATNTHNPSKQSVQVSRTGNADTEIIQDHNINTFNADEIQDILISTSIHPESFEQVNTDSSFEIAWNIVGH